MYVEDVRIVINLDYPAQTEDYVHRIGRTARSGAKGTAYSFFTRENAKQAPELIQLLKDSNQDVNEKLFEMSKSKYFGNGGNSRGGNNYRGGFDRRGGGGRGGFRNNDRNGSSYGGDSNNNNNNTSRPTRFSNKRSRSRSPPPVRQSRFDNNNSHGHDYKRARPDNSRPSHDESSRNPYSSSTNGNGMHSQRTHQKSHSNGITVPSHPPPPLPSSSSSSSTSNPYSGFYNQASSYPPPPSMYPPAYQMYAQPPPPLPPGPPPSSSSS